MTNLGNSVFVYGIDIGSEYSGYAYVSRHDITLKGPPTLSTPTWIGSLMGSHKCPTVILLDRNEEMVAFGYEAENKFVTIMEDDETNDYYYFKHFRDQIHQVFIFLIQYYIPFFFFNFFEKCATGYCKISLFYQIFYSGKSG